jgi:hypothetical protein
VIDGGAHANAEQAPAGASPRATATGSDELVDRDLAVLVAVGQASAGCRRRRAEQHQHGSDEPRAPTAPCG